MSDGRKRGGGEKEGKEGEEGEEREDGERREGMFISLDADQRKFQEYSMSSSDAVLRVDI